MIILPILLSIFYPVDSWQNILLDEIQVRGVQMAGFSGIRPYNLPHGELPQFVALPCAMDEFTEHLQRRLWMPDISGALALDSVRTLRLRPALYCDWADFSLMLRPVVKFGDDGIPPFNRFMDLFAGDNERAFVRYDNRNFGAFVGRERFSIGPSPRYNLLLSSSSVPADWLSYYFQAGRVRLSIFLSRLDDMTCKPIEYVGDTVTQLITAKRFISIRRLDVAPYTWLNFSFSEAALEGGEELDLSFYDLIPLVLSHTNQYNYGHDANIFFHLDAEATLQNARVYGALLVDDFQLDPDPNGEPNHLGFNAGVEFADVLVKKTFVLCEYTMISRYAYCHFYPYQRYEFRGAPLGYPYGPDCDDIFVQPLYHMSAALDVYGTAEVLRKGSVAIDSLWPIPEIPRVPGTRFPSQNFLSGIVQRSVSTGFGMRYNYRRQLAVDCSAGATWHSNYHNIEGERKTTPYFKAQVDIINLSR
jgi:hypothetical protein